MDSLAVLAEDVMADEDAGGATNEDYTELVDKETATGSTARKRLQMSGCQNSRCAPWV